MRTAKSNTAQAAPNPSHAAGRPRPEERVVPGDSATARLGREWRCVTATGVAPVSLRRWIGNFFSMASPVDISECRLDRRRKGQLTSP